MNAKTTSGFYPFHRPRRNRKSDWSRRLVRENTLSVNDLIWPIFIIDGENKREPVKSMPGVERLSVDLAVKAAEKLFARGVCAPEEKVTSI